MSRLLPIVAILLCTLPPLGAGPAAERVYVDQQGTIRWRKDDRELALFGANYSLASACDYRAAGYVGADRKKLVEQDFAHFARMGWDGVRLCFWGDWENCDVEGNLIANDHLDVLDHAIATAAKRGIGILFTPITTYSSLWPDLKDDPKVVGFSRSIPKNQLGTDSKAIAAQVNYLRQLLNHVNPYTGVALKDEPAILFIEMINEPWHHSADLAGSISYINALAEAVKGTGCQKLLFHNLSQDFEMVPAIKAANISGLTFAWYPTGLNARHRLQGNYLRTVDEYPPMDRSDLRNIPKLVYEFDSADMDSGYMYPAMVRTFRGVGAQFVAMFSYDMLATAPYNLGWQTHFLNLVYSPRKAVSAVIAAEAMRRLPAYSHWGDYPDNRRFGPFRVSYENDLSEMVTNEAYFHSNSTTTLPADAAALTRIVGTGSSPIVTYEGNGAYFLDRISPGVWRLELYPDAVAVLDPFAQSRNYQTQAIQLVEREWPMTLRLPDLGDQFHLEPLNADNHRKGQAKKGRLQIGPGVYLLSRETVDLRTLPDSISGVGLREFICPKPAASLAQVLPVTLAVYPTDRPARFEVQVIDRAPPLSASLHLRQAGAAELQTMTMNPAGGYRYAAEMGPARDGRTDWEYFFTASTAAGEIRYPVTPGEMLRASRPGAAEPRVLFSAKPDGPRLFYTRIGDDIRHGLAKLLEATAEDPAALRLYFPASRDAKLSDYTASLEVKDRFAESGPSASVDALLRVKVRGSPDGGRLYLRLVESDGTAWGAALELQHGWQELRVPIAALQITRGVMLPLGFPGRWNYWVAPAKGRGSSSDRPRLGMIEHLQFSLGPESKAGADTGDPWIDIATVTLDFSGGLVH